MLKLVKIILAKNIWSVVAIWSIWSLSFWLSHGTNICYFICRLVIFTFTYQPHHTSTTPVSTPIHVAVLPLLSPDRRRRPKKRRGSNTSRHRGDRGIAAAKTAGLAPWARPPMRCVRAGAALIASDWEGFDACGEEDCGERPARDGDDAGTGGSRRVAAPRPHRQQLRGLDATAIIHNLRTVTPRYGELLALLVYLTLRYVDYEC